ncbi:MAG: hypothetical protein JSR69_06270 [Proteobacteria bacterium]|nr:hypothetical protein [Pseudomonadota bacterium]
MKAVLAGLIGLLAGCASINESTRTPQPDRPTGPFRAQVVGVQWMNPLVRRDYPTEWQLLWTQGLARPNKNDDMVRTDPASFSTIQPVAAIVWNISGRVKFSSFFGGYMEDILRPFGNRYVLNANYFYTIQPKSPKDWHELAGIHIEFALPDTPLLPQEQAIHIVRNAMNEEFQFYNPRLSTRDVPADVHVSVGGASVGFTSLTAALDYLKTHPKESVWAMTWDSPDHPKDEQMTENCVLLVLAGPDFDTKREPLAWIGYPAVHNVRDFETSANEYHPLQAWQAAIRDAATQADTTVPAISHVIHDAGFGSDLAGRRLAQVGHALGTLNPEFDFATQTFNTPKLLGDMRAGTALTNVALAIAWTHQKGKPVLVLGTTETDRLSAVVVTPPARPRIFDPNRDWFRARGEGNAYLPWWGLRKDADWATYPQGFSD